MAGTLYVVATPIGNLEDLSPRAARVLREADVVAAEDTRAVQVLLDRAGAARAVLPAAARAAEADGSEDVERGDGAVDGGEGTGRQGRRLVSVFEGNEASRAEALVAELVAGKDVALVSEAGTPGVSDPGERVVRAAIAAGIAVVPVPGPVAAVAALIASGLPSAQFRFVGFPPREAGARAELFGGLRGDRATLICYEAPDRVGATLATMAAAFGGARGACVSREITKRYEEHVRGTLDELAARFAEVAPRGECTIVVAGAAEDAAEAAAGGPLDIEAEVRALLASGLGPKDVAQRLVVKTGKPRRELYQLALSLARASGDAE